jgi:hypothetical protein
VERGNSRRVDSYLAIKCREVGNTNVGFRMRVMMLLIVDKSLYEIGEVRLRNFGGDIFWVDFEYCNVA